MNRFKRYLVFFGILFLSISFIVTPLSGSEYITREELNQQAMEDSLRLKEEMEKYLKQRGQLVQAKPTRPDYEKYNVYFDFKNVFFGSQSPMGWQHLNFKDNTQWAQNRKAWHKNLITSFESDFIVLPVEDFSSSNDLISRKLSADYIATGIGLATGQKVMPPEMILGYLDNRSIVFDDSKINEFETNTKTRVVHLLLKRASSIVKDKKDYIDKELALVVTNNQKVERFKFYKLKKVSEQYPLDQQIFDLVPDIVKFVTGIDENPIKKLNPAGEKHWALNHSIAEGVGKIKDPLDSAAWLQFIAYLTPGIHAYEKDRLFERSIACLMKIEPTNAYFKIMMARALLHLHRRPLALAYISNDEKPESVAMKAYINGNYYTLKETLAKIKNPLLYTLAYLDLLEISEAYGKPTPEYNENMASGGWRQIIQYAIFDNELWKSVNINNLINTMGYISQPFNDLVEREIKDSMGPDGYPDPDKSKNLLNNLITEISQTVSTSPGVFGANANTSDFLMLYRHILIDLPIKPLKKMVYRQGAYTSAVQYAQTLAPMFSGLPAFDAPYAYALYHFSEKNRSTIKSYYRDKAFDIACNLKKRLHSYEDELKATQNIRSNLPKSKRNVYYGCTYMGGSKKFYPSDTWNLQYTVINFQRLIYALNSGQITREEFDRQFADRFDGSPDKIIYSAELFWKEDKKKEAVEILENAIEKDTQGWRIYELLGQYHIKNGEFEIAKDVYLSFPEFADDNLGTRVGKSNIALEAAEKFRQIGRLKEAEELYRLCIGFQTGSGGEIYANYRLAVMDNRFHDALNYAKAGWERYQSFSELGRYFSMKSMLSSPEDLTAKLKKAVLLYHDSEDTFSLYKSILVNQHIRGFDFDRAEKEITSFQPSPVSDEFKIQQRKLLFLHAFVDRKIEDSTIIKLHKYNSPQHGQGGKELKDLGKIFAPLSSCPSGFCDDFKIGSDGFQSSDEYAHFALGLHYLDSKQYQKAAQVFLYYDTEFNLLRNYRYNAFILPYAVISFLHHPKTDSTMISQLEDALTSEKNRTIGFPKQLTLAIIKAAQNDKSSAIEHINEAMNLCNTLGAWKISAYPTYQLSKMLEWMYDFTKDSEYIELGLKWAKMQQTFGPYNAWTYAFEAVYSKNEKDRIRAAGFSQYLDRQSQWLSRVPADIRKKGTDWWKAQDILKEKKENQINKKAQKI